MAVLVSETDTGAERGSAVGMITLYHFCCEMDMRGIRTDGITKGMVALQRQIPSGTRKEVWQTVFDRGWQWLTYDGDHDRQSWATNMTILTNRLEYRFTVELPDGDADQLYDRNRLEERFPGSRTLFDGWPGSENWVVYRGNVSKYQLKKLEHWNGSGWEEVRIR